MPCFTADALNDNGEGFAALHAILRERRGARPAPVPSWTPRATQAPLKRPTACSDLPRRYELPLVYGVVVPAAAA
jgi:hypothetical protein